MIQAPMLLWSWKCARGRLEQSAHAEIGASGAAGSAAHSNKHVVCVLVQRYAKQTHGGGGLLLRRSSGGAVRYYTSATYRAAAFVLQPGVNAQLAEALVAARGE